MTDDEDEQSYEVERILYQKPGPDPTTGKTVTLYLVKWEGYPEEQCSWEPRENFDSTLIFEAWAKQWNSGDVLDEVDLKRVQDQIDALNARKSSVTESNYTDESDEGSDTIRHIASTPEPSPKRQKLVHDAPLLKKNKEKRGIARPVNRRSTSPAASKQEKAKKIRLRSPLAESGRDRVRTAAPPLHRPANTATNITSGPSKPLPAPRRTTTTKIGTSPMRKSGPAQRVAQPDRRPSNMSEPPSKFHVIEIAQRKRADDQTIQERSIKRAETKAKNNEGKPFRNLQHQNAVRKKLRDIQHVPPSPLQSRPVDAQEVVPAIEPTYSEPVQSDGAMVVDEKVEQPQTDQIEVENDAAKLFFSDSDPDDQQDVTRDEDDSLLQNMNSESKISMPISKEPSIGKNAANERAPANRQKSSVEIEPVAAPPETSHSKLVVDVQNEGIVGNTLPSGEVLGGVVSSERQTPIPSALRNATAAEGNIHPERRRRNSLFQQQLPAELRPTAVQIVSKVSTTPVQSAFEGAVSKDIRPPVSASDNNMPNESSRQGQSSSLTSGQHIFRIKDGHMTREILKGDLLCHIMCQNQWIGAVQFVGAGEECCRRLLHSKPKENKNHQLTIHFESQITRAQYKTHTSWFCYHDTGTLEPFEDSMDQFVALAQHLEDSGSAVIWNHPFEDYMGVLYPCKSSEWRDLGSKPGRRSEARLCVAFRPKFADPPHQSPAQTEVVLHKPPIQATDPRRRSVSTNARQERQNSTAVVRFPPAPPQDQSAVKALEQPPSAPGVQKVHTANAKAVFHASDIENDAMDVDEPSEVNTNLNTSLNSISKFAKKAQIFQSSFPGLNRSIEALASVPKSNAEKRKVVMMLVYNADIENFAQQVKDWLINNGQPWEQILKSTDQKDMDRFRTTWKENTSVILFDKHYQVSTFRHCSTYLLRTEYFLCWQLDYKASTKAELGTTQLFPTGQAICMSEAAYTTKPRQALKVLKHIKYYIQEVQKPYASSVLVLPPKIVTVLLEEAHLTENDADKRDYKDLVVTIIELINLKAPSILHRPVTSIPNLGGFDVIETEWSAVYKAIPEKRVAGINDIQRMNKDKEGRMNLWFSAWALMNLDRHRKFFGIRAVGETGLPDDHHVSWAKIADFLKWIDPSPADGKRKPQNRERGRTENQDEERARSRSLSVGSNALRTPTTPAFRY